jgi:WD40 repeat protein
LGTLGKDIFDLRHIIIDEQGKMIVDKIAQGASDKKQTGPIAEWQLTLQPKGKVFCMAQNPFKPEEVAVGFKDTLLQLWDMSKKGSQASWQARNLPNDELDLQIPIFDTDISFLDANHIVATTGYGEIREYDIRGKRRPLISSILGDK